MCDFEIRHQLLIMYRMQFFYRFQLNNHLVFDKKIQPIITRKLYSVIDDWKRNLLFTFKPTLRS